jgi:hypothetical protein
MKDVRLTKTAAGTWDVKMTNGAHEFIEDGSQAAQHSTIRLMIFKGELSLNGMLTTRTEEGTKWYETIFNMALSTEEKQMEIKRRLLGTPGIKKITKLDWSQSGHTVTISDGRGVTDWGEIDISQEIELL